MKNSLEFWMLDYLDFLAYVICTAYVAVAYITAWVRVNEVTVTAAQKNNQTVKSLVCS